MLAKLLEVEQHLDSQIRRLSLGERMKMELIGSILHSPEILFLDEPTIGLDIIAKKNIRRFLNELQKEMGTTLILTSHDMDDIESICERVIVIDKGSIVYDSSLRQLIEQYKKYRYVRFEFDSLPDKNKLPKESEIIGSAEDSYLLKVSSKDMVPLITELSTDFNVLDIHIESVPLDEIIANIFTKERISEKSKPLIRQ